MKPSLIANFILIHFCTSTLIEDILEEIKGEKYDLFVPNTNLFFKWIGGLHITAKLYKKSWIKIQKCVPFYKTLGFM